MRFLILGGTQFLGRAVAVRAVARGHDVTCAARGVSGTAPPKARFVPVDRDRSDGLSSLLGRRFDAVVDVSRHPGQVRRAVAALKGQVDHWTFVSTTSVYVDTVTRGQRADTAPLLAPTAPGVERSVDDTYGAAKVACEQAVGEQAFVCRPGLIVGPDDPSGRFSYWVARLARGGEVLVPENADDPIQIIDVRDIARWIVHAAEIGILGYFDGIGPIYTRRRFLTECQSAIGSSCTFTWVDREFLDEHDIGSGSGPRSLPLPLPDSVGDNSRDNASSLTAGLRLRTLAETVRETWTWLGAGAAPITGLTAAEEAAALRAWHATRA